MYGCFIHLLKQNEVANVKELINCICTVGGELIRESLPVWLSLSSRNAPDGDFCRAPRTHTSHILGKTMLWNFMVLISCLSL